MNMLLINLKFMEKCLLIGYIMLWYKKVVSIYGVINFIVFFVLGWGGDKGSWIVVFFLFCIVVICFCWDEGGIVLVIDVCVGLWFLRYCVNWSILVVGGIYVRLFNMDWGGGLLFGFFGVVCYGGNFKYVRCDDLI